MRRAGAGHGRAGAGRALDCGLWNPSRVSTPPGTHPVSPPGGASSSARVLATVFGVLIALGCGGLALMFLLMSAFASDPCGASATCDTDAIGTAVVAVFAGLGVLGLVALVSSIVFASRAPWRSGVQAAVLVGCAVLAGAVCVGGFLWIASAVGD